MKIAFLSAVLILTLIFFNFSSWANEEEHGHDHEATKEASDHGDGKEDNHSDHGDEKGAEHSDHGDEKDHEEKAGAEEPPKNVGPGKGVVSYSEKEGFQLSPEATKKFGLTYVNVKGTSPWEINTSAIIQTGADTSVYRNKNGIIKRIDISIVKKGKEKSLVSSKEIQSGDQIIVTGVSFLRTAELDLTSGESGHHH